MRVGKTVRGDGPTLEGRLLDSWDVVPLVVANSSGGGEVVVEVEPKGSDMGKGAPSVGGPARVVCLSSDAILERLGSLARRFVAEALPSETASVRLPDAGESRSVLST